MSRETHKRNTPFREKSGSEDSDSRFRRVREEQRYIFETLGAKEEELKRFANLLRLVPVIFILIIILSAILLFSFMKLKFSGAILFTILVVILIREVMNMVLSLRMNRRILAPIEVLKKAMEQVAKGNYVTIKNYPQNEVGMLIEDFNKMSLELRESKRAKEKYEYSRKELIAGISHDLKTPITSILGYSSAILDGVADSPDKLERYLHLIGHNASYTNQLIDDLFLFSKLEVNQLNLNKEKLPIRSYFEDLLEEKSYELEEKDIHLTRLLDVPNNFEMAIDSKLIHRVMTNIITNAIKYGMGKERRLYVQVKDLNMDKKGIEVSIRDYGRGIPEEVRVNMFNRFYRGDASRNKQIGGSGLGLAIAKEIVKLHHGEIWAESEEGMGTVVTFTLIGG